MRGYYPAQNDAEQLLIKRVKELSNIVRRGASPRFLGFLDEREQMLARAALSGEDGVQAVFWGGWPQAQRCFLGVGEDKPAEEAFPFELWQVSCPHSEGLNHRDYLGSLLGLGLKREALGDILVIDDSAFCFVTSAAARVLEHEQLSVGRYAATAQPAEVQQLADYHVETTPITIQSASLRADAVLSQLLHLGREQAAKLIETGRVAVNHLPLVRVHDAVQENDILSVRGYGRYRIVQIGGTSRKGRIWITAEKYE